MPLAHDRPGPPCRCGQCELERRIVTAAMALIVADRYSVCDPRRDDAAKRAGDALYTAACQLYVLRADSEARLPAVDFEDWLRAAIDGREHWSVREPAREEPPQTPRTRGTEGHRK